MLKEEILCLEVGLLESHRGSDNLLLRPSVGVQTMSKHRTNYTNRLKGLLSLGVVNVNLMPPRRRLNQPCCGRTIW